MLRNAVQATFVGHVNGAPLAELNLLNSIYSTPIVANNVLDIANKNTLYALETGALREAPKLGR